MRNIESDGEVDYCIETGDFSSSGPDVVELDFLEELQKNGFPDANSVKIGSPVPGILIACLTGVRVLEGHFVFVLLDLVMRN